MGQIHTRVLKAPKEKERAKEVKEKRMTEGKEERHNWWMYCLAMDSGHISYSQLLTVGPSPVYLHIVTISGRK